MKKQDLIYAIDNAVFEKFPGYARGIVLVFDTKNGDSPSDLVRLLRDAEASVREKMVLDKLTEHPRIASWRDAYRAFGAKPAKFRPSMEAMARRVLKNQALPSINALVDIGNIVSLNHLVPVGGHAIDVLTQDLSLRPAKGDEMFVPFGSDQVESPEPGEIIFAEGDTVITRRWTWRQAHHTLTLPTTTDIEFNVDGLPPVSIPEIEAAIGDIIELVGKFCGGRTRHEILTAEHPSLELKE